MPGEEFEVAEQLFSDRWMQKIGEVSALPVVAVDADVKVVSAEVKHPAKKAAKKVKKGEE